MLIPVAMNIWVALFQFLHMSADDLKKKKKEKKKKEKKESLVENTAHANEYAHSLWFALFCCGLVQVSFTHILQDYSTQCQKSNPEEYG